MLKMLTFTLDGSRYALLLSDVKKVVSAVEITPLPTASELILGVINVQGEVLPVIDMRRRFKLKPREIMLEDVFIVARSAQRNVVLVVDAVANIVEIDEKAVTAAQVMPFAEHIKGVVKLEDGLSLICDLDQIPAFEEETRLAAASSRHTQ